MVGFQKNGGVPSFSRLFECEVGKEKPRAGTDAQKEDKNGKKQGSKPQPYIHAANLRRFIILPENIFTPEIKAVTFP